MVRINEASPKEQAQYRLLSIYQILLVVACIYVNFHVFHEMGWLQDINTYNCNQQPAQGENAVFKLHDAFNVDRRGLTS